MYKSLIHRNPQIFSKLIGPSKHGIRRNMCINYGRFGEYAKLYDYLNQLMEIEGSLVRLNNNVEANKNLRIGFIADQKYDESLFSKYDITTFKKTIIKMIEEGKENELKFNQMKYERDMEECISYIDREISNLIQISKEFNEYNYQIEFDKYAKNISENLYVDKKVLQMKMEESKESRELSPREVSFGTVTFIVGYTVGTILLFYIIT